MVKNLSALQETRVRSLGQEDPPGEGNGYPLQYSCLEKFRQRSLAGYSLRGRTESDTSEQLSLHFTMENFAVIKPALTYLSICEPRAHSTLRNP